LLLIGTMSAGLAACGGGGGDSGTVDGGDIDIFGPTPDDRDANGIPDADDPEYDENDIDGDGTENAIDPDIDGDMLLNGDDPDVDGDGVENASDPDVDGDGQLNGEDLDIDGDGIQNTRDPDMDGDTLPNGEDPDMDGDGQLNEEDTDADGDGFDEPTAGDVCGDADGMDANSSNFTWDDNCTVRRGNQFADSLYSAGIQRVVYCSGFGSVREGLPDTVDGFTDGEYGPGTEEAVTAFQTAYNMENPDDLIGVDGQVGGEQTWPALQAALEVVEPAVLEGDETLYDGYGIPDGRCGDAVLFLNEVRAIDGGTDFDRLGWRLTKGATDPTPVPFSVGSPFGVID